MGLRSLVAKKKFVVVLNFSIGAVNQKQFYYVYTVFYKEIKQMDFK